MQAQSLKKADFYLIRLLKLRPRSCFEVSTKLLSKGYDQAIVDHLVEKYQALGFLNDEDFAKIWMTSRLKKYGFYRVKEELKKKGIAPDLLQKLRSQFFDEDKEKHLIEAIVKNRFDKLRKNNQKTSQAILKRRLMDFLLRRGFLREQVMKVIRSL